MQGSLDLFFSTSNSSSSIGFTYVSAYRNDKLENILLLVLIYFFSFFLFFFFSSYSPSPFFESSSLSVANFSRKELISTFPFYSECVKIRFYSPYFVFRSSFPSKSTFSLYLVFLLPKDILLRRLFDY